ncbi:MAG: hypothetical protein LBU60_00755, partial [Clostridiales bacterium]|nr:hypothetical protein [Clostridiales bacterium]
MRVNVKRMIVVSIALMLMLPLVMGLVGCSTRKVYTSGFFEYTVYEDRQNKKQYATIVRFSESGREQEVLDIPREIEGIEVYALGGKIGSGWGGSYPLENENLKKMYIHDNITSITREALGKLRDLDIMYCGFKDMRAEFLKLFNGDTYNSYIYIYIYSEMYYSDEDYSKSRNVIPANIEFLNNYSTDINGGYYRLDNIESGERIPEPPAPGREGYD